MNTEDISPFFSRCQLKASRQALVEKNQRAGKAHGPGSPYSTERSPDSMVRQDNSPDYSERDASGRFDTD